MYLLKVLVQHKVYSLNREFVYYSNEDVKVGARVSITFNEQKIVGFVNEVVEVNSDINTVIKEYGFEIKKIDEIIDRTPILNEELLFLAKKLANYYLYPLIGVMQTMLPPSLKPKDVLFNAPKIKYETFYTLNDNHLLNNFSKNELKILDKFNGRATIKTSELNKTKALESLINKNIILLNKKEVNRYNPVITFSYEDKITLNEEQTNAYNSIINSEQKAFLLKGVTGSGKTEVYIKLVEYYLNKGKSAIILVPEIALTPLMISRLLSYFKGGVAVLHSSLTDAQKYDEYRKIASGEAKITIGTRSAIFAPNVNLGLIIIDEENDECYKQDDQFLLYNAKEVALLRSEDKDIKIVFGSATPSIELIAKALKKQIGFVELKHRYKEINLPKVSIINRLDHNLFSAKSSVFSLPMIMKLNEVISNNEQAILLINSRGYATYLMCRDCGHVFKCPTCGLPLHYHKEDNSLYCHHCDYKIKKPTRCPNCGNTYFSYGNFGIEKVEEDFKRFFKVPYLVLDSDRTSKTYQIERVLRDFNDKKANILIGTQLVSKGHDFKEVSFVGILNADTLLNYPNYRSKEITFNLITQTIGRAGRNDKQGYAMIQTSFVNDYAILTAANQDYEAFFNEEIKMRKLLLNPPFMSICSLELTSKNNDLLLKKGKELKRYLLSLNIEQAQILGPTLIRKSRGSLLTSIFIKYKKLSSIKDHINDLIDVYKTQSNLNLRINFNPFSF